MRAERDAYVQGIRLMELGRASARLVLAEFMTSEQEKEMEITKSAEDLIRKTANIVSITTDNGLEAVCSCAGIELKPENGGDELTDLMPVTDRVLEYLLADRTGRVVNLNRALAEVASTDTLLNASLYFYSEPKVVFDSLRKLKVENTISLMCGASNLLLSTAACTEANRVPFLPIVRNCIT